MAEDRLERIISLLDPNRETTVKELAQILFVSESSVRRDLTKLLHEERIVRTFRGAKLRNLSNDEKVSFLYRTQQNSVAKEQIAIQCLPYIHDGDTIMMDDSSTVMFVLPHLRQFKNLTVITNCIRTSYALCELGIFNYVLGGAVQNCKAFAYLGSFAESMLRQFHANLALFSCKGISSRGMLSSGSEGQDALRRIMLENCQTSILLCDSSKIGHVFLHDFASVQDVDVVLCDKPLPEQIHSQIGLHRHPSTDIYNIKKHG